MHRIKDWGRVCVLTLLTSAVVSCGETHGAVDEFLAARRDFDEAACRCLVPMELKEICDTLPLSCSAQVVSKHAGELGSWLTCVTPRWHELARCIEASDCSGSGFSACVGDGIGAACGEQPKAASTAIERETMLTCTEDIDCDDGSVVSGKYCDGTAECDDRSDEEFCDVGSDAGAEARLFCDTGDPVPIEFRCDGNEDCDDGHDELECEFGGSGETVEPMFTCLDGQEVDVAFVCDSEPDCSDGEDERACFPCSFDSFSGLIRSGLFCDGVRDCPGGEDETAPNCPTGPLDFSVTSGAFTCENNETLDSAGSVCDGFPDCTQGDDEEGCFSCSYDGARLRRSLTCDGVPDCTDGSDEIDCL